MPEDKIYYKMHALISQLSKKYGTPYFEPHVTLIGEIQCNEETMILNTSKLASTIKPFKIELATIDSLNDYYKCLFIKVKQNTELIETYKKASKIFRLEKKTKFLPHLSLMYGDLKEQEKKRIKIKIGKEINITFDVNSIHLFSINGNIKDWHRVEKFKF